MEGMDHSFIYFFSLPQNFLSSSLSWFKEKKNITATHDVQPVSTLFSLLKKSGAFKVH